MAQTVSASASNVGAQHAAPILAAEDPLAQLMKVTFDADELVSFFDAFAPLDSAIVWASSDPAK